MQRMLKILLILLIIYIISLIILFFFQEKLIFQGSKLSDNHQYTIQQKFEELNIKTKEGNINALHLKVENPKGIILYFHGNRDNLERWSYVTSFFSKFRYDVFIIDYRNYGKSKGKLKESLLYNDALVCYDYVKNLFPENKITLYGRSLGCAFAIKTASKNNPKQLILEAPFYNLKDVAKKHYPFVPFNLLLKYQLASNKYIDKVTCNTTIFHGTEDQVILYKSGVKLFEKSNKKHTNLITIKNGTHHDLMEFKLYEETILSLLE